MGVFRAIDLDQGDGKSYQGIRDRLKAAAKPGADVIVVFVPLRLTEGADTGYKLPKDKK